MSLVMRQASGRTTSIISFLGLIIFLPLFIMAIGSTITILTRASGTPANIVVDTSTRLEPIKTDFYHAFAQGGEEQNDMLQSIAGDVRALRPQVIRIDHLYDSYQVVGRDDNGLTFDWTRLDAVVNTIISTGAKPVLALSYMPNVIAKDGVIINPPNDWNEWSLVVQKTIEHYSGKGARNLNGVYYEVWNEPDLAQFGSWKLGGEKNYLTLYRYAAIGANNAQNVNQFFLGGPSTTGLYKNWIIALAESGNRLNFFSWHSYLSDPEQFATDQRNIISWLVQYPSYTLLPKLITEFGFTGSKSNGYGTMYGAAHTAAVIRQLISGGPTYLMSFQLKDGPNQSDGSGWGLITHDDNGLKKKPRYSVYSFIDTMAGTRMQLTGEGSWVTGFATIQNDVMRVLLVNFDSKGSHTEQVPVKFTKLAPGSYKLRERFLFGRDATKPYTVEDGTLTTDVFMPSQSIGILELTRDK
ncbi:MAG: GH39 family glycosyl hydrolase [Patescibacteria group bacterium]